MRTDSTLQRERTPEFDRGRTSRALTTKPGSFAGLPAGGDDAPRRLGDSVHPEWCSKAQIIERIREVNRSAARDWLEVFTDGQLQRYLQHLLLASQPRDGRSRWIHAGDIPAVIALQPEA
jgi:hypothetical protein